MRPGLALVAVATLTICAGPAFAQSPPPPPVFVPASPPPLVPVPQPGAKACQSPDYRAFDFWVGEWDVYANGSTTLVATSSIEAMFGGCVIRETWKPRGGGGGGSFSHYDAARRQWRQAWVDSTGGRVDFDGGAVGGKMILTGLWRDVIAPGQDALTRMSYTANPDGSVRQYGEQSTDHGLNWSTSFDLIYKPRATGKR